MHDKSIDDDDWMEKAGEAQQKLHAEYKKAKAKFEARKAAHAETMASMVRSVSVRSTSMRHHVPYLTAVIVRSFCQNRHRQKTFGNVSGNPTAAHSIKGVDVPSFSVKRKSPAAAASAASGSADVEMDDASSEQAKPAKSKKKSTLKKPVSADDEVSLIMQGHSHSCAWLARARHLAHLFVVYICLAYG